jgi:hypothetical protein
MRGLERGTEGGYSVEKLEMHGICLSQSVSWRLQPLHSLNSRGRLEIPIVETLSIEALTLGVWYSVWEQRAICGAFTV